MNVNEQSKISINGALQYVSIRSEVKGAPLLLYLHGGPGDAALPLVRKHQQPLEKHFTVVVWEQRGAGKSHYKFGSQEAITIDLFRQDLAALTQYLLTRFDQEKLYLIGHSWGSVLGLGFCGAHPEWVRAYLGCGQVVNMRKSAQAAYDFAVGCADRRTRARLLTIDPVYTGENWLKELLFVTRLVVKYKGSLYGKSHYRDLVKPILSSPDYSLRDLVKRQRGSLQSIKALWPELMGVDFEQQKQFAMPIIFVEGRHDRHVSSALVKDYYDTLQSDKDFYWFEQSGHFPQWSEPERFNELVIKLWS